MTNAFIHLSPEEKKLMYRTPALIAVLIAGTDGKINTTELETANMLTNLKKITSREILRDYYDKVRQSFPGDMNSLIEEYPDNSEQRQWHIIDELTRLNEILPKVPKKFAIQFLTSMKDYAGKIAESAGGFLGFLPTGYEESKLVGLEMIHEPA